MNATQESNTTQLPAYRSGSAARLAGIPVETLRVWERRYKVVGPRLSPGGQRLYSSAEVKRLTLIRQLVDMGHPISAVAALEDAALAAMRSESRSLEKPIAPRSSRTPIRVVLVGSLLTSERFVAMLVGAGLEVVGRLNGLDHAANELSGTRADALLVELPTVQDADLDRIQAVHAACGAAHTVVFYRFAPSAVLRRLRMAGHTVTRTTSDVRQVEALCRSLGRRLAQGLDMSLDEPAPPRFDEATLSRLAGAARTVECECPRHLVDLIMNLAGFERYSAECVTRNPQDESLHLELKRAAGRARSLIEEALEHVARAEGLELPPELMRA
jgi:DNA-binding transcriptional MerR regulator